MILYGKNVWLELILWNMKTLPIVWFKLIEVDSTNRFVLGMRVVGEFEVGKIFLAVGEFSKSENSFYENFLNFESPSKAIFCIDNL